MNRISIANQDVGEGAPTFIIAEAGVNHNGSLKLAKKLINTAKTAGSDAIKFQAFQTSSLVTKKAKKASYQMDDLDESQYEMLKKLEMSEEDFYKLSEHALEKDIIFLSSPFDVESVDVLEKINLPAYKLASGEINNTQLLKYVEQTNKPIIMSTGMATIAEIKKALEFISDPDRVILLHCISEYPVSPEDVNLKFIKTLIRIFKLPVGFSDHTLGINIPIAAVTMGACLIEKHLTLDKNLVGPDHKASLEPKEFKRMIDAIREVEKAIGTGEKILTKEERKIKKLVRKSIVANSDIENGTIIEENMISVKRPGTGIEPAFFLKIIGKRAKTNIKKDELITWDMLY